MTKRRKNKAKMEEAWQRAITLVVCMVILGALAYGWRATNEYEASLHETPVPIQEAECAQYEASGVHVSGCEWYVRPTPVPGSQLTAVECYAYVEARIPIQGRGCEKWGY
jgi:hypothetical protein